MSADPATQSNYLDVTSKHLDIFWTIDWKNQIISGSVTHDVLVQKDDVKEIILDTSYLTIDSVTVDGGKVKFSLGDRHKVLGSALSIPLPSKKAGDSVKVAIKYSTTKDCTAVGWLEKEQTTGKKFPYLYSQCEAIHCRSLLPVQDTPAVKITYSASVSSTLPALVSALRVSPPSELVHGGKTVGEDVVEYKYDQPIAIPSYLIAIASGNLVYRAFDAVPGKSWKTGVWTEPETMDAAYWEFSKDTANFVLKAEEIAGVYDFGVYDLLILPGSFPFGGMENANLTFATPTLLSGDRSLVDVVAHEISHSWFGNNVGCASWADFWLNEGWTTYSERLLVQSLHGPAARDFSYIIGRKGLLDDLKDYVDTPKYQRLYIPFDFGEDPDDAFSRVPYDKGSNFLLHLERSLGGLEVFLPYMRDYVATYKGKSITTEQWKAHLYDHFGKTGGKEKTDILDRVDWNGWLNGEGLELPVDMTYDTALADQAYSLAARWDKERSTAVPNLPFSSSDVKDLDSNQKVVFLEKLTSYKPLPKDHIAALHDIYSFSSGNAEVAMRFYQLGLASGSYVSEALAWVVGTEKGGSLKGRMKFCRPIFREAAKIDKKYALKIWKEHRIFFHPIARNMIDKDLAFSA